jgi:hypothetical protein
MYPMDGTSVHRDDDYYYSHYTAACQHYQHYQHCQHCRACRACLTATAALACLPVGCHVVRGLMTTLFCPISAASNT